MSTPYLCPEAFDWLFEHLDRKLFLNSVHKDHKQLLCILTAGGFKLMPNNLDRRRSVLRQKLPQLGRDALAFANYAVSEYSTLIRDTLQFVRDDALRQHWRMLIVNSAEPGLLILALFRFPDNSWQKRLALRLLRIPQAWRPNTVRTDGLTRISATFSAFCAPYIEVLTATEEITADTPEAPPVATAEQLQKEYQRGIDDQKKHQADNTAALSQTRAELNNARQEIASLRRQLDTLTADSQKQLQTQKQQIQAQYEQSFDSFCQQAFQNNDSLLCQSIEAGHDTAQILDKLHAAIQAQQELNRQSGTKSSLRQQRDQLQETLDELQNLVDDSCRSIRSLPNLLLITRQQIARLNALLKDDEETLSFASAQLKATINSIPLDAQAEKHFGEITQFIANAVQHGLLFTDEQNMLLRQIDNQRTVLKRLSRQLLDNAVRNLAAPPTSPTQTPELWFFARNLPLLPRVTLIMDGYNVMKRNDVWLRMETNSGFNLARQHFINTCKAKTRYFTAIELVFDSPHNLTTREAISDKLSVTFAAHVDEEHNADNVIINRVRQLRNSAAADLIWVVTDDHGLRSQIEGVASAFIPASAIPNFFLLS